MHNCISIRLLIIYHTLGSNIWPFLYWTVSRLQQRTLHHQ